MTTEPAGEPQVLATFETHHLAVQRVEVVRAPDGTVTVVPGETWWGELEGMPATPNECVWDDDTAQWRTSSEVAEHLQDLAPDVPAERLMELGIEVAVGDSPPLPHPDDTPDLAQRALAGLRDLHRYTEGPDEPSAADTCEELYRLLRSLGMEVS